MKKLLAFCHFYILLIGLTSYKLVNGRFRQTRMSQLYAWTVNVILLAVLPCCLWLTSVFISSLNILPRLMKLAPFGVHVVNYAVIVYTVASRSGRDRMLLELQKLIIRLDRASKRCGIKTSQKLRRLLYLKIFTWVYQTVAANLIPFLFGYPVGFLLTSVVVNFGYSTLLASAYTYFISFWHITQGYDLINRSVEELITGLRPHSISHLWKLHINLSRTARRLNGYFESQMLALRVIHFLFSVIDFYVVTLILNLEGFPWYFFYLAILHTTNMLDFFLNDYIIDLTVEYHHMRMDSITEGTMSKELNAFILYQKSMKLDLMVCGLFKANRTTWLLMAEGILCYFIVLVHFRLANN